jgi:phosphoglycolate phosphatase
VLISGISDSGTVANHSASGRSITFWSLTRSLYSLAHCKASKGDVEIGRVKRQLLIFDFDGTLADSFDVFVDVFDEAAELYRFDLFDRHKLEHLRTLDVACILKHHRVPAWKLPFIARTTRKTMASRIENIHLFPGIAAVIARLHKSGFVLALATSNSKQNALKVLGPQLSRCFDHLECGISIFGKRAALKRILKRTGFVASETMLIGDELRDLYAAESVNISFGAVGWGYTSIDTLTKAGADEYFESATDITLKLAQ